MLLSFLRFPASRCSFVLIFHKMFLFCYYFSQNVLILLLFFMKHSYLSMAKISPDVLVFDVNNFDVNNFKLTLTMNKRRL